MSELLSRPQVAQLIDRSPNRVPRWAAQHGIRSITGLPGWGRRHAYRAAEVHAALGCRPMPAPLRLARFIRNPLNHTTRAKEAS